MEEKVNDLGVYIWRDVSGAVRLLIMRKEMAYVQNVVFIIDRQAKTGQTMTG